MARSPRDFETEAKALHDQLTIERWKACYGMRALEEDWARHILGVPKRSSTIAGVRAAAKRGIDRSTAVEAAKHLANAETWQAEVASYATGGGEGLMYWAEVLDLRLARAWLLSSVETRDSHRQAKKLCRTLRPGDAASSRFRRHLKDLTDNLARGYE